CPIACKPPPFRHPDSTGVASETIGGCSATPERVPVGESGAKKKRHRDSFGALASGKISQPKRGPDVLYRLLPHVIAIAMNRGRSDRGPGRYLGNAPAGAVDVGGIAPFPGQGALAFRQLIQERGAVGVRREVFGLVGIVLEVEELGVSFAADVVGNELPGAR